MLVAHLPWLERGFPDSKPCQEKAKDDLDKFLFITLVMTMIGMVLMMIGMVVMMVHDDAAFGDKDGIMMIDDSGDHDVIKKI